MKDEDVVGECCDFADVMRLPDGAAMCRKRRATRLVARNRDIGES